MLLEINVSDGSTFVRVYASIYERKPERGDGISLHANMCQYFDLSNLSPSSLGFSIRFQRGLVGSSQHGILLGYETPGVCAGQGGLALRQYWHRALPGKAMPEACHTPAENLPGN